MVTLTGIRLEEHAWGLLNELDDNGWIDPEEPIHLNWYAPIAHAIQMADSDSKVRAAITLIESTKQRNCLYCRYQGRLALETMLVTGSLYHTFKEKRIPFKAYLCENHFALLIEDGDLISWRIYS